MTVSICCITYNHENFIAQAIEGIVMQQTNFDCELIIGDDKSTDRTALICREYKAKYPGKIKLILNEANIGMMPNFIQTLNACSGKYIAFCEGDDYWTDPFKLQKQVDFLEANPGYVLSTHRVGINSNGKLIDEYLPKETQEATYTQVDLLEKNKVVTVSAVCRNPYFTFPTWYKRAMPGDYPLWLMLTAGGGKINYTTDVMAVYRVHGGGIWSTTHSSSKYLQQYSFTMLWCAKHLHIQDKDFIIKNISKLYRSVNDRGYKEVSRGEYASFVTWAYNKCGFSIKKLFRWLMPVARFNFSSKS